MIYNSTITSVNESDIMELLESTDNRFENYTMAEATAIVVGEQEANWTRFMQGVGLSELNSVMEGEEIVYEGARFDGFIRKAKGFFEMALSKLAEITKRFVAKLSQFLRTNDSFLKQYRSKLVNLKPEDVEFDGYKFQHMDVPEYASTKGEPSIPLSLESAKSVLADKESKYTEEKAEELLLPGAGGDTFGEKLTEYFFGSKTKETIQVTNAVIKEQVEIISKTKEERKKATESYKKAAKEIKTFIKKLNDADKKAANKKPAEGETSADSNDIASAYNTLITFWKYYSNHALAKHGTYLRALGSRNRQAKAICVKALNSTTKEKGKADRERIKARTEGFVNAEAFLGAVEFI